jgi:predicted aspartyl protease
MRRGLILAPALALAACMQVGGAPASADVAGEGEVPFTLAGAGGAAMVVPVSINGTGPYQFVLDTGATLTCLDQTLAERLELAKPVGMIGYGATVGQSGAVALYSLETLDVGPASTSGLTACALDLRGVNKAGLEVDGLLGLNFLKSYKVAIDFERQVLTLSQP